MWTVTGHFQASHAGNQQAKRGKTGTALSQGMSQKAPGIGSEHEEQGNNENEAKKCTDHATTHRRNYTLVSLFVGKAGDCRPEGQPSKTDCDSGEHHGRNMKAANRNHYDANAQTGQNGETCSGHHADGNDQESCSRQAGHLAGAGCTAL